MPPLFGVSLTGHWLAGSYCLDRRQNAVPAFRADATLNRSSVAERSFAQSAGFMRAVRPTRDDFIGDAVDLSFLSRLAYRCGFLGAITAALLSSSLRTGNRGTYLVLGIAVRIV
jgi:hypothetical protein